MAMYFKDRARELGMDITGKGDKAIWIYIINNQGVHNA